MSLDVTDPKRYLLFVSFYCPFARRTLIARALMNLSDLEVHVLSPLKKDGKWAFGDDVPGASGKCKLFPEAELLADVYKAAPLEGWDGVNSVPYLVDKETKKGVSNGSAAIIAFLKTLKKPSDAVVYEDHDDDKEINKFWGFSMPSYAAGEAKDQAGWDDNISKIDAALAFGEEFFSKSKFRHGDKLTRDDLLLWGFYLHWDIYLQHVSGYHKPILSYYPSIAAYVSRIAKLIPNPVLVSQVYNQYHLDVTRAKGGIVSKQPDWPLLKK